MKVPNLTFSLSEQEFLEIAGDAELDDGYDICFVDRVNRKIIDGLADRVIAAVPLDPDYELRYKDETVRKITSGPGFAVVLFNDGEITKKSC